MLFRSRPERFLSEVTEALTAFENESIEAREDVEARALALYEAGMADMARDTLDAYSTRRAEEALELGQALLGSVEARHRLLVGYRAPENPEVMSTRHGDNVSCLRQ